MRAALFAPGEIEYTREQDDLVMECVHRAVEWHARRGRNAVVLDGRTYVRRGQVEALRALAEGLGAALLLVECTTPPAVARARLAADRAAGAHPAADRSVELYERLRAEAEPIAEPKLVLDTSSGTPEALARRVLAHPDSVGPA